MTNKLKSPELSRRGFLIATGTLGALTGVALAGCTETGAGSSETRRNTSETQRSDETQQNNTSGNKSKETEQAADKLTINKEDFLGWETMTPQEQERVFDRWLEQNGINEPMPEYTTGEGTASYAEAIVRWFVKHRCRPLSKAYRDPDLREYAVLMARDVLTCNGKNPKGTENRLYETVCDDDVDRFDPKTPFAYSPYTLTGTTDIANPDKINVNIPGHDPDKAVTHCIAMFESGSFETDTLVYLWVQLAFGTDTNNPNEIRAIVASYSDKPRLKNHPEIEFHEVKKQTV